MVFSTRIWLLVLALGWSSIVTACDSGQSKPAHNWSSYDQYEDNDAYYTAPKGFGFCGGEMAICE